MVNTQEAAVRALTGVDTLRTLVPGDADRAAAAACLLEDLVTNPEVLLLVAHAAWDSVTGTTTDPAELAAAVAPELAGAVETTCAREGCGHNRERHRPGRWCGETGCDCTGLVPYCAGCGRVLATTGGESGDGPALCRDCTDPDGQDVTTPRPLHLVP